MSGNRGNMYYVLPSPHVPPQPTHNCSLAWPETWRERITYLIILPIIIPLWLTLPDTRKPSGAVPSVPPIGLLLLLLLHPSSDPPCSVDKIESWLLILPSPSFLRARTTATTPPTTGRQQGLDSIHSRKSPRTLETCLNY